MHQIVVLLDYQQIESIKNNLGCIECCRSMIPGYFYTIFELTGRIYYANTTFNPYDSNLLVNQLRTGRVTDDNEDNDNDLLSDLITEQLTNCKYITPEQVAASKNDELKTLSHNIRSIYKNMNYMRENIEHFNKYDVMCFNETNCTPETLPNGQDDLMLDGFHPPIIKKPKRASGCGGGLVTYVNKRVCEEEFIEILELSENTANVESLFVQVKIKTSARGTQNHVIGNFYRSPSINKTTALTQIEDILTKLDRHKNKRITLLGDFNIDLLQFGNDPTAQALIELMTAHGFSQLISKPTRITDHSATLIDHIYTNRVQDICKSGLVTYDMSDHIGTYVSIALYDKIDYRYALDENLRADNMKFNEENQAKFKDLLENENWDDVLNETDTQLMYDKFIDKYSGHYNTAFKVETTAPRKKQRASPKPWILPWLEEACDRKNRLYIAFIIEPTEKNKTIYDKMKKFVKKQIRLAKRKYYNKYFEQHSSDSRKLWQMINSLLNRGRKKRATVKLTDSDGRLITEPLLVAEKFNDYFSGIADTLKADIRINNQHNHSHMSFLGSPSTQSIFINPTHPVEINKIILSLKNKTTSDTKINAMKTATAIPQFNILLTHIINSSFETGVFPSQLKNAKVVPIHKGGSKTDVSNYRPISLLSCSTASCTS